MPGCMGDFICIEYPVLGVVALKGCGKNPTITKPLVLGTDREKLPFRYPEFKRHFRIEPDVADSRSKNDVVQLL